MNLINAIIKGWHQIKLSRDLQVKYSYNLWHEASFIGIDLLTDRAVRSYFSHFLNNAFSSCVFLEHLACMACFWLHSMQQMPLMAARVVPALILMKILSTLWIKSKPLLCLSGSGIADLFVESISDCFHLLLQKHIHYLSVYFHLTTFKLVNLMESIYWSVLEIDLFCSLYCTFYACVFFVC